MLTWWRHQPETFSALLAICVGNSPVPGEFPEQRPVTRGFDVFFDLRPNKRLSNQEWGWWLRHRTHDVTLMDILIFYGIYCDWPFDADAIICKRFLLCWPFVTGRFPSQRPAMWSSDYFFVIILKTDEQTVEFPVVRDVMIWRRCNDHNITQCFVPCAYFMGYFVPVCCPYLPRCLKRCSPRRLNWM